MADHSQPTLGVIGAPDVAQALRDLGFRIHTAGTFREAATLVSLELKGGTFPVIVAETDAVGFSPWVASTASKTRVVLLKTRPDLALDIAGAIPLSLPATVNELMPLVGYQASTAPAGVSVISPETPNPLPAPAPLPLPNPTPAVTFDDAVPVPVVAPNPEQPYQYRGDEPAAAIIRDDSDPISPPVADSSSEDSDDELFDVTTAAPRPEVIAPAPAPAAVPAATPVHAAPEPEAVAPPPAPVYAAPEPEVVVPAAPEPKAAAPVYVAPAQPLSGSDTDDFFDARPRASTVNTAPLGNHKGTLIIPFAGKGGVGKSTLTLAIAKIASEAGLRTIAVDGNRGQADIGTYLRLPKDRLPTIYDAVRSGDPAAALILPEQYNPLRPSAVEPLDFAIVQGPPRAFADPDQVTAEDYAQVIDYARARADIVVLDTQILEAHMTDLFERLVVPALLSGAWSVGIVSDNRAGVDNLLGSYRELSARGVGNSHSLLVASRYPEMSEYDQRAIESRYGEYATFVGSTGEDPAFHDQMNLGNILSTSPAIEPAVRAVLYRVTGNQAFAPRQQKPKRRGLGSLFGGR